MGCSIGYNVCLVLGKEYNELFFDYPCSDYACHGLHFSISFYPSTNRVIISAASTTRSPGQLACPCSSPRMIILSMVP